MKKGNSFTVSILSPDSVVFEGECTSLTATNAEGLFDLLPDHARFITLIENEEIQLETKEGMKTFTFPHAVLFFEDNSAKIYVHIS